MVKDIKFEASTNEPIKLKEDLNLPEQSSFKFTLTGEADRDFLKSLMRLTKRHAKMVVTNK